jgi:ribulose-5-phosphate 4-epimerase/fuculose-1-phosphate aldolase
MNRVDAINRGMDDLKTLEEVEIPSLKDKVSEEEWKNPRRPRRRLPPCRAFRLGRSHLHPFVGADPGAGASFSAQPVQFDVREVTASSLIKVDTNGNPVEPTPFITNPAGFTIHSAVHMAREDAHAVMHLHTPHGQAVSAHSEGLLPLTQTAMLIRQDLAFHDYEGVAVDLDERERLVEHLGGKNLMLLRNHGTLAVGPSVGECFVRLYFSSGPARRRSWLCRRARTSTTRLRAHPRPPPSKARSASPSPQIARLAGAAPESLPSRSQLRELSWPEQAASVSDFRAAAKARLPHFLFEYIDGGSYDEVTLQRNVEDLRGVTLRQRVMRDVSTLDLTANLFGPKLVIARRLGPVGMSGMYARRGEVQAARAASTAGVPFALSTLSSLLGPRSRRQLKSPFWLQLYMIKDRAFLRICWNKAARRAARRCC